MKYDDNEEIRIGEQQFLRSQKQRNTSLGMIFNPARQLNSTLNSMSQIDYSPIVNGAENPLVHNKPNQNSRDSLCPSGAGVKYM